jgi:signal transduction histidine kinase
VKILDALTRQPKWRLWVIAFLFLSVIGAADYAITWQFSLFMFYAFAIFGVAWSMGLRAALPFAGCCVLVSFLANWSTYPLATKHGYFWSALNRSVAFCFVSACGAAIRSYRDEARARVEAMEKARRLEQQIVRTSESEQMRIGQDLHDGVCQSLSAIDCATECLRLKLEASGGAHAKDAMLIQKLLRETTLELRNIARSISPVHLTGEGLRDAVQALVATTSQLRNTAIIFRTDKKLRVEDPNTAIHLYRITQEALSNAMRHAQASRVELSLLVQADTLTLTVADDGRGLPPNAGESRGMGLHTMQYRAHLIGASFTVENNARGGLTIRCAIPVGKDGARSEESATLLTPEPSTAVTASPCS